MANKKNNITIDTEFNQDVQKVYLEWFLTEPDMFALCRNIIKPEYFDDNLRPAARFIMEYSDENSSIPFPEQVRAKTGVDLAKLPDDIKGHSKWLIKEIEKFCRTKALELVVYDGIDLINQNRGGELEKRVRDAMSISLMTDLGANYFKDNIFERLEKMRDRSGFISTGWQSLDDKLFGGVSRASLNTFLGRPGEGKSCILQNISLNFAFAGLNVVYFSLELSEQLIQFRFDAMTSGMSTREVIRNIPEVSTTIKNLGKNAGELIIKKLPEGGTTVNDFRAFLKEYEIKTGQRFDVIVVDYLDLMYPTNVTIDPGNLFIKDKYVSEELRALSFEYDVIICTASQINRQGTGVAELDNSHVAGGISKVNTSDNVIALNAPTSFKEHGKMELQFLKTRTSSAVGSKIELSYDPQTMRITDMINFSVNVETLRQQVNEQKDTPVTQSNGVGDLMKKLKKT